MRPTRRNLVKRSVLLLSPLFSATSLVVAGQDVDIIVNIKDNACQNGVSSNGNIDLGVVGVGDLTGNISTENYRPDGKEFAITIQNYILRGIGNMLNQLRINFRAFSGVMAIGSSQAFANKDSAGVKNVGVVMFSTQDSANTFDILGATGSSCSVYPVMSSVLNDSFWKFST